MSLGRCRDRILGIVLIGTLAGCNANRPPEPVPDATTRAAAAGGDIDRTVLPIPEPATPTITEMDARKATAPPRFEVKAPQGAPNVVIVLIDDIGFGHSSAFGGPVQMPTAEKLAGAGLRFNRFHTTSLCSPTRTASTATSCGSG